jgi:hypothetical protein
VLDFLHGTHVTVVRMVEKELALIQHNTEAGAMRRFDHCSEVLQQRFDLTPMDVAGGRVMENRV